MGGCVLKDFSNFVVGVKGMPFKNVRAKDLA
jgi:hypothetical protein